MRNRIRVAVDHESRSGNAMSRLDTSDRKARCLTALRFLIDENLSVKLPEFAHKRGFEASHVAHLGLREWKDWNILGLIEAQNCGLGTMQQRR